MGMILISLLHSSKFFFFLFTQDRAGGMPPFLSRCFSRSDVKTMGMSTGAHSQLRLWDGLSVDSMLRSSGEMVSSTRSLGRSSMVSSLVSCLLLFSSAHPLSSPISLIPENAVCAWDLLMVSRGQQIKDSASLE